MSSCVLKIWKLVTTWFTKLILCTKMHYKNHWHLHTVDFHDSYASVESVLQEVIYL